MILSVKLEDAVVVFMAGLAQNILEREGNAGKVTRIECTTTVSPKPFTIEVRAVQQDKEWYDTGT